jgi:hypothetical protein
MSKNLKQDRQFDNIRSTGQLKNIEPKTIPTDYQRDVIVETPEESLKIRVARYYSSI